MKKKYIISAMAFAMAVVACQSDDYSGIDVQELLGNPVDVVADIYSGQQKTRVNTTGTGDVWSDGDTLFLQNTSTNAVTLHGKDKGMYVYKSSDNKWHPIINSTFKRYVVWCDSDHIANSFEAYFPCLPGVTTTSFTGFTLPQDQTSDIKIRHSDYMTADTTEVKGDSGRAALTFYHQLCKVTAQITTYNNNFKDTIPYFDTVQFFLPDATGTTTLTTDSGKTITMPSDGYVYGLINNDSVNGHHTYTALLAPGKYDVNSDHFKTFGGTLLIQFNDATRVEPGTNKKLVERLVIGGNSFLTKTSGGFKPGKSYFLSLTMGKDTIKINRITIKDWIVADTLDTATADYVGYPDVIPVTP